MFCVVDGATVVFLLLLMSFWPRIFLPMFTTSGESIIVPVAIPLCGDVEVTRVNGLAGRVSDRDVGRTDELVGTSIGGVVRWPLSCDLEIGRPPHTPSPSLVFGV